MLEKGKQQITPLCRNVAARNAQVKVSLGTSAEEGKGKATRQQKLREIVN